MKPYYVKGVHRFKKKICSKIFYRIVVLESFAKFTGKHLSWSQFIIKLQALGEFIQEQPLKVFVKKGVYKNFAIFTGRHLRMLKNFEEPLF